MPLTISPDAPQCCAAHLIEWLVEFGPDGFNQAGFDREGFGRDGYDRDGYNRDDRDSQGRTRIEVTGYDRDGYNRAGYNRDGYDRDGYDRNGYDREGYDRDGYDRDGYDAGGYNRDGYNQSGYNRAGYDASGYNRSGYNRTGYDRTGYDRAGYDRAGYNRDGYDRHDRDSQGRTRIEVTGYDGDGYDRDGYDRGGYNRDGYDRDGYDRDGYDRDGYDASGEMRCCVNCDEPEDQCVCSYGGRLLHSYSFVPELTFYGNSPTNTYYGIEFEVSSSNSEYELAPILKAGKHGDLIWLKEDGSVNGFEAVTHPMTYEWAMAHFPWHVLETLHERGCRINTRDNGIHIHVSRNGFSSPAHLFRWMKLIYRNEEPIVRLAGRRSDSWAKFSEGHRHAHAMHAKMMMKQRNSGHGVWPDDEYDGTGDRYSAINTTNDETLEVRLFASTLDPTLARMRLQVVAATVEYTRGMRTADVRAGAWDWPKFQAWLMEHEDTYPDLARIERSHQMTAVTL